MHFTRNWDSQEAVKLLVDVTDVYHCLPKWANSTEFMAQQRPPYGQRPGSRSHRFVKRIFGQREADCQFNAGNRELDRIETVSANA